MIKQASGDPEEHDDDVGDAAVDVCTAIKCRLDQFNGAAEGACTNEYRQQAKLSGAGKWEGQSSEGNKVDNFVAVRRRRRWWLAQWPEHRDRERKEDDECQGDVEVFAHRAGVPAPHLDSKLRLL